MMCILDSIDLAPLGLDCSSLLLCIRVQLIGSCLSMFSDNTIIMTSVPKLDPPKSHMDPPQKSHLRSVSIRQKRVLTQTGQMYTQIVITQMIAKYIPDASVSSDPVEKIPCLSASDAIKYPASPRATTCAKLALI
jgi:hypothetical protein